jgi:hypothetical protein
VRRAAAISRPGILCDDHGREMLGEALTLSIVDRIRVLSWRVAARVMLAAPLPATMARATLRVAAEPG